MKRSLRSSRRGQDDNKSDRVKAENRVRLTPQEIQERCFLSNGEELIEIRWQHLVAGLCGFSQTNGDKGGVVCLNPVDMSQERSVYLDHFADNMAWGRVCSQCYVGE